MVSLGCFKIILLGADRPQNGMKWHHLAGVISGQAGAKGDGN